MENPSVKQRVDQFDIKNGSDCINIDGFWLVYSNGAMRERNPLGALIDPPTDVHQRCKIQLRYHEKRLQRAVDAFDEHKQQLIAVAQVNLTDRHSGPPPDAANLEKLKDLQKTVRRCKRAVAAARQAVTDSTPDRVKTRDARSAENKSKNEQFISAVKSVQV